MPLLVLLLIRWQKLQLCFPPQLGIQRNEASLINRTVPPHQCVVIAYVESTIHQWCTAGVVLVNNRGWLLPTPEAWDIGSVSGITCLRAGCLVPPLEAALCGASWYVVKFFVGLPHEPCVALHGVIRLDSQPDPCQGLIHVSKYVGVGVRAGNCHLLQCCQSHCTILYTSPLLLVHARPGGSALNTPEKADKVASSRNNLFRP